MKINIKTKLDPALTFEGGPASRVNYEEKLRRAVSSCFLWEGQFYEDGQEIAVRIAELVPIVDPTKVFKLAVDARQKHNLRHIPLFLAREMARYPIYKGFVGNLLPQIIKRADELAEFLALYWKGGRCPLAKQVKKGLAESFKNFDEYQLAKYNQNKDIKLKDVLFLVRPKPENEKQAELWNKLANDKLETPDTWEVELSKSKDKKASWERLLVQNKLGALALLRNLRNCEQAGVNQNLIIQALMGAKTDKVLPFRFLAAAKYAPRLEPYLEELMLKNKPDFNIRGKTVLMVDVSGSMNVGLGGKSELTRIEAANALAILLREICDNVVIYTFAREARLVPARRGFALRDAIMKQFGGGTQLKNSMTIVNFLEDYDQMVIITDEQSQDGVGQFKSKGFILNVASYQNGVKYNGNCTHIHGFSESCARFIAEKLNTEVII
jgi:hypothetical protein